MLTQEEDMEIAALRWEGLVGLCDRSSYRAGSEDREGVFGGSGEASAAGAECARALP